MNYVIILGYLPGAGSFRLTTGLESTPVHHFHGTADPVVRYEWATKTKTGLEVWTLSMLWMYSMYGLYMYVLSILCKSCMNIYILLWIMYGCVYEQLQIYRTTTHGLLGTENKNNHLWKVCKRYSNTFWFCTSYDRLLASKITPWNRTKG